MPRHQRFIINTFILPLDLLVNRRIYVDALKDAGFSVDRKTSYRELYRFLRLQ